MCDDGPFNASIIVPLPRIVGSHPDPGILTRSRRWPQSARCAISGHSVYWKPGFAPGLGWYHILGQYTLPTTTQGSVQAVKRSAPRKPENNEIIMLSHIYDFWKAGLLAIHPDTLRVRCFVPSDVIRDYDNKAASFPESGTPDLDSLRVHYEICVWVNMTAALPRIPLTLSSTAKEESMFHEMASATRSAPKV
ncbi:hypothetical protein DHEL01_v204766 [Diaporthe helianthi]|uniref:HNH nuclease domain-containing protein n=1 Tax=Diaporthe helianthi TaxID=158607 RepID=A0A2P5I2T1_DIAHE|nr:hypothetical protein DHEL01_v204766 [Diaporthe helianthi]